MRTGILHGIPTVGKEIRTPGFTRGILGIDSTPTSRLSPGLPVSQLWINGLPGQENPDLSRRSRFSRSVCIPAPGENLIPSQTSPAHPRAELPNLHHTRELLSSNQKNGN